MKMDFEGHAKRRPPAADQQQQQRQQQQRQLQRRIILSSVAGGGRWGKLQLQAVGDGDGIQVEFASCSKECGEGGKGCLNA